MVMRICTKLGMLAACHYKEILKGVNSGKVFCFRVPVNAVSVALKFSMTEERWQDCAVCFGRNIRGTKSTMPKNVRGSTLSKDVEFRVDDYDDDDKDFNVFNYTYRISRSIATFLEKKIETNFNP
jgi:hypothetical protein